MPTSRLRRQFSKTEELRKFPFGQEVISLNIRKISLHDIGKHVLRGYNMIAQSVSIAIIKAINGLPLSQAGK